MTGPASSDDASGPLFLIGPGRSGTTLLYELLAQHPDLAWVSNLTGRFPRLPQLAALSRVNDVGTLGRRAHERRLWPRPVERYEVWERHAPGLSSRERPDRPIAPAEARALREWARLHLRWQGGRQLLIKYTGYPRIAFVRSVFPGARFVYIDRDPRAVVYSQSLKGWHEDDIDDEALRQLDRPERLDYYAGRYMRFRRAKLEYPADSYRQLFYERLVADPVGCVREVCEFARLAGDAGFDADVAARPIDSGTNDAYRRRLDDRELAMLDARLEEPIRALGYR